MIGDGYEVIYQKGDNSILHRRVKNRPVHGIGDKTSYGWVVKDILYIHCGKTYTYEEYLKKIKKTTIRSKIVNIDLSKMLKIVIELLVLYFLCVNFLKF